MNVILNIAQSLNIPQIDTASGPVLSWLLAKKSEDCRREIFEFIRDHFEWDNRTGNAYLRDCIDKDFFIYGALKPDSLRAWAKRWNTEIQTEFLSAVYTLNGMAANNASLLPVSNGETYRVMRAAEELNNSWSPFATHAVLLPVNGGESRFSCILPESAKADIIEHPENYVIVTVQPG